MNARAQPTYAGISDVHYVGHTDNVQQTQMQEWTLTGRLGLFLLLISVPAET